MNSGERAAFDAARNRDDQPLRHENLPPPAGRPRFTAAPVVFADPVKAPAALAFLRTADADGKARLQTASIEYKPTRGVGPSIWLVGVAHLGTKE